MNSIHKIKRNMKNKMLRSVVAFLILVSIAVNSMPVVNAASYTDVPSSHWAYDAVEYVTINGYMNGVGNNLFNPDGVLSRAQIITVLYRVSKDTTPSYYQPYNDVVSGTYYYNAVCWANSYSLSSVIHTSPTVFSPDSSVSRVKIAELIWKFAQTYGWATSTVPSVVLPYTDIGNLTPTQINALKWCYYNSIMIGVSSTSFGPNLTIKRAQLAKLIYNLDEYIATNRAFCVGTKYANAGLDTTHDATLANTYYGIMGYNVACITVPTVSIMQNTHHIKSNIIFFCGHADYDRVYFNYMLNGGNYKTGVYYGTDANISGYNYEGIIGNMDFVKLAVFAGNRTAAGSDNIVRRAAQNGANYSLGWANTVSPESLSIWLERFNYFLTTEFNPGLASVYAGYYPYPDDNVRQFDLCFGGNYINNNTLPEIQSSIISEQGINNILANYEGDVSMNGENDSEAVAAIIQEYDESFQIDDYNVTVYKHNDIMTTIVYQKVIGGFETDSEYIADINSGKLISLIDQTKELSEEEKNRLLDLGDRLGISSLTKAERTESVQKAEELEKPSDSKELTEALHLAQEQTQSSPTKELAQQRYRYYYEIEKKTANIIVYTEYYFDGTSATGVDTYYYNLN